ncbi:two-component sensor histidine kinase [Streptomyces spinoverrucosus]|uniref:histidine kinase n=1 Tax=Streptomyces spinoverrucosus TaxID=284043 RepID=A0A4Y3VKA2_9ACTN|nr:HAMP domain-containing sensor histidine kinase [Streptomyces spinoverrucosus]GEC06220.1 two-component sensor histidine kinase [Streptomyces spinoverrucosus]GHB75501.1 two-component sensor histidine kinase [Streptomyces spinoverrucosus]
MTPGPRIPWHKSLLVRLLLTSIAIAVVSVGATAWLAVQTTTRAIQEERGQVLSDDTDILRRLSGFAATHADWDGVQSQVRDLSRTMGRRIALTTEAGHTIADSAAPGTALPARASATVDPLNTDTYTEPGAQLAGIDPRAVGPYLLPAAERVRVKALAEKRLACVRRYGGDGSIRQLPSGRTVLIADGGEASVPLQCADGALNTPTRTEQKALDELNSLTAPCLGRDGEMKRAVIPPVGIGVDFLPGPTAAADDSGRRQTQECVDDARRTQLDPYVAPRARLYLGALGQQPPGFDLSTANKAKIVGVAGLVLVVTVATTTVVAIRLVRPLRALTAAARQPPQRHTRVAVTTKDETGYLAAAFNDLTTRREQLEAQRKAMVSDIAHELRTPLTNIRGWLEVTRDGLLEPDPELIASLHDEALLLQHIIDDLQDLAAADAGTLALHREPVRADDLVAQTVSAHRARAESSGIRLCTHTDPDLGLDADPVRMRQVLGNLTANALRHTPAGGTVTLTARQAGDMAVLTVQDTGSGIAADDLPHVFERFWRAEKSRSRRTGGSGLGLSIVRQFVEAHEGTVTVDSEPGKGCLFTIRLPQARDADRNECDG